MPEVSLSYLIVQLCRSHRGLAGTLLAAVDLHPGQEAILMQLWREDGQSQKQLAERLRVQPPTVTKMLQRLEASGIIERRPSNHDGRVMTAHLTDQGRALESQVAAIWQELERRSTQHLEPEEQRRLAASIGKVIQGLRQGQAPEEPC